MVTNIKIALFAALTLVPRLQAASVDWAWTLNTDGTFSGSEAVSTNSVTGTYTRLANGFLEMTKTGGSGALIPANATKFYPIEVPGFAIVSPPVLSTESQLSVAVTAGTCPTNTLVYNWVFFGWKAGSSNTSVATQGAFGKFTWDNAIQSASIDSIFNLSAYALPAWFSGAIALSVDPCANGLAPVTGAANTDRAGDLYLGADGGFVFQTDANKSIFGAPQKRIPASEILNQTYTTYIARFDSSGSNATNIVPTRVTLSSDGSSGTGDVLSNVSTSTTDGAYGAITIAVTAINSPYDGFLKGTITRNGTTGKLACLVYFTSRTVLFCVSQSEHNNAIPANLTLVSDEGKVGTFDPTFMVGGLRNKSFSAGYDGLRSVMIASDDKFLAAGYAADGNGGDYDLLITKYRTNGVIESTFGTSAAGSTVVDVGAAGGYDTIDKIFTDGSNRIYVAGQSGGTDGYSKNWVVARFSSSGALDTTFATAGVAQTVYKTGANSRANGGLISHTGHLLIGGQKNDTSGANLMDCAVHKMSTNGNMVTSFGTAGVYTYHMSGTAGTADLCYDFQEKVDTNHYFMAGSTWPSGGTQYTGAVMKIDSSGAYDTTFGTSGRAYSWLCPGGMTHCWFNGMYYDSAKNKIYGFGQGWDGSYTDGSYFVAKFNSNGSLDTSFGTSGKVHRNPTAYGDVFFEGFVDSVGYVYGVGYKNAGSTPINAVIVRFKQNGNIDTTFGTAGTATMDVWTDGGQIYDVTTDSSGRLVGVGTGNNARLFRIFK